MGASAGDPGAVSYTHLDVYKRQALLWVHAAVCAAVVGIAFYGLDSIQLFALAAACALVLRAGDPRTTSDAAPR